MDLRHIAELARLKPSEQELDKFAKQCADILNYIEVLSEVDTKGVEPLYSPIITNEPALRADEVREKSYSREQILQNAPLADDEFFIVPKIV